MMTKEQELKWADEQRSFRHQKDEFFRLNPSSPIPVEHREKFQGLEYFPLDASYRFELQLEESPEKKKVQIQDTGGNTREFLLWGDFHFEVDGVDCVLHAYKGDPSEDHLFVPFRDASSGHESYGAGRYLDLYEDRDMVDGIWVLDFNLAYNPYCAYSPYYVCPFVPPENWLNVEIKAGEKAYPLSDESQH